MALAQAVYDNAADADGELSFRRGDVLVVLEKGPCGLEGWWLCGVADGRQGIAPANRLKELPTGTRQGNNESGRSAVSRKR